MVHSLYMETKSVVHSLYMEINSVVHSLYMETNSVVHSLYMEINSVVQSFHGNKLSGTKFPWEQTQLYTFSETPPFKSQSECKALQSGMQQNKQTKKTPAITGLMSIHSVFVHNVVALTVSFTLCLIFTCCY